MINLNFSLPGFHPTLWIRLDLYFTSLSSYNSISQLANAATSPKLLSLVTLAVTTVVLCGTSYLIFPPSDSVTMTQKRKASSSSPASHKRTILEPLPSASIPTYVADVSESYTDIDDADRSVSASPTLMSNFSIPASIKTNTCFVDSVSTGDLINSIGRPACHATEMGVNDNAASGESSGAINAQNTPTVATAFANTETGAVTNAVQAVHNSIMRIPICDGRGFPIFHSGNVIINTGLDSLQSFQLHSTVLARHSSWFRYRFLNGGDHVQHSFSLEEVNGSIQLVHHQPSPGDSVRQSDRDETPNLVTEVIGMGECASSTVPNSTLSPLPGSNNKQASMTINRHNNEAKVLPYYHMFGSFYSIRPILSTTDLGDALIQAEELVKVATTLDCLDLIRSYIGNIFAQYRQKLFLGIRSDPARWIKLAVSIEDTSIYTECLIHLVGAHPNWIWPTSKNSLSTEICQLISKKSTELDQLCVDIDRDLLMITINVGRGRNHEPVPCHRSQIETWIVVQLFRDTVARCLHSINKPKQRSIQRGSIYRKIHKGGSAYLEFEEVQTICHGIMQTSWRDLGGELSILKEYASEIVREVAVNELMIDPEAHKIGYLTCAKIKPEDIPWQRHPLSAAQ